MKSKAHTLAGEALLAAASFAQRAGDTELAETLSNEAAGGLEGEAAFDAAYLAAESAYKQENYRVPRVHMHDCLKNCRGVIATLERSVIGSDGALKLGDVAAAAEVLEPLYESGSIDERFLPGLLAVGERAFTEERWEDAATWFRAVRGSIRRNRHGMLRRCVSASRRLSSVIGVARCRRIGCSSTSGVTPRSHRAWYEIGMLRSRSMNKRSGRGGWKEPRPRVINGSQSTQLQQLGTIADRTGNTPRPRRTLLGRHGMTKAALDRDKPAQALLAAGEHIQAAGVLGQLSTQS